MIQPLITTETCVAPVANPYASLAWLHAVNSARPVPSVLSRNAPHSPPVAIGCPRNVSPVHQSRLLQFTEIATCHVPVAVTAIDPTEDSRFRKADGLENGSDNSEPSARNAIRLETTSPATSAFVGHPNKAS